MHKCVTMSFSANRLKLYTNVYLVGNYCMFVPLNNHKLRPMLNPITLKNFKAMYESENDYLNHEIAMHKPDEDDEQPEEDDDRETQDLLDLEDNEMEDLIDPENEN